jgi:5-methylcytosine-specific restriction endonuclease McrA
MDKSGETSRSRLRREEKSRDSDWRNAVREKYGFKCTVCGSEKEIQLHHVVSRTNQAVRWYVPNGVPLCANHHVNYFNSAHRNTLWFIDFIVKLRGDKWKIDLLKRSDSKIGNFIS